MFKQAVSKKFDAVPGDKSDCTKDFLHQELLEGSTGVMGMLWELGLWWLLQKSCGVVLWAFLSLLLIKMIKKLLLGAVLREIWREWWVSL